MVYNPNDAIINTIGEAFRFRKGLYKQTSQRTPINVARIIAKRIESHTGYWSCMEKK